MRNYEATSFNEVYGNILKDLITLPEHTSTNRGGDVINEMINASFTILEPMQCFATVRNMSMDYLKGELGWYLSGSPFLEDIQKFSKFWDKVSDDGRSVISNYGKLLLHDRNLHNWTQFEYAVEMLKKNKESKSAVMIIYAPEHSFISNDNPCTMYLHFLIRKDKLNLFVKMRSSDIWYGLPYDVPFFVCIQRAMLRIVSEFYPEVQCGFYNHQAGSLHCYLRNLNEVAQTITRFKEMEEENDWKKERVLQEHYFVTLLNDYIVDIYNMVR